MPTQRDSERPGSRMQATLRICRQAYIRCRNARLLPPPWRRKVSCSVAITVIHRPSCVLRTHSPNTKVEPQPGKRPEQRRKRPDHVHDPHALRMAPFVRRDDASATESNRDHGYREDVKPVGNHAAESLRKKCLMVDRAVLHRIAPKMSSTSADVTGSLRSSTDARKWIGHQGDRCTRQGKCRHGTREGSVVLAR